MNYIKNVKRSKIIYKGYKLIYLVSIDFELKIHKI